jgi:hypothetical protein
MKTAPPVYKPASASIQRSSAPSVYRPQQMGKPAVQPKAPGGLRVETRPAPPVYRPTASAQMKATSLPGKNFFPKPALTRAIQPIRINSVNRPVLAHEQPYRPIQLKPASTVNIAAARNTVVQRVRAYRVGTSASSYKIQVAAGKITSLSGGTTGIDISFGDADHANYYFATKKSDSGAVMDEWEFPDDVYELIVYRMKHPMKQECPNDKKAKLWEKIKKLPAPVNSTDSVVTKGGLIAPHFPIEWIPILDKYSKGKTVTRTTVAEAFPVTPVVSTGFKDDDLGTVYLPADDDNDEEALDDQITYGEYVSAYKSGGYAFRL